MLVEGKLIECKRTQKELKGRKTDEKLFISLAEVKLSKDKLAELKEVYKDSGDKFTPEWVKNFDGYVNISTKFELPMVSPDGHKFDSIEDYMSDGNAVIGATVKLSLNLKEGAVYPKAIVMLTEGTPYDPFEEFGELPFK